MLLQYFFCFSCKQTRGEGGAVGIEDDVLERERLGKHRLRRARISGREFAFASHGSGRLHLVVNMHESDAAFACECVAHRELAQKRLRAKRKERGKTSRGFNALGRRKVCCSLNKALIAKRFFGAVAQRAVRAANATLQALAERERFKRKKRSQLAGRRSHAEARAPAGRGLGFDKGNAVAAVDELE